MAAIEQQALVVEVGSEAWSGEARPRAVPGDVVLISKYAGHLAIGPNDGVQYRFVNANDVFAQIVEGVVELKEVANG